MAWVLLSIALVFCVTSGGAAQEEANNFATILVSANADDNPGTPVNSSVLGVFGLTSLRGPVTGKLVHVETSPGVHRGCTEYRNDVELTRGAWVALIERGSCAFPDKVGRAFEDYNATAVIVYDNTPNKHLTVMNARYTDGVYVFVNQNDGMQLAQQVNNSSDVNVTITMAKVSSSPYLRPPVTLPVLGGLMALLGVSLVFRQPV